MITFRPLCEMLTLSAAHGNFGRASGRGAQHEIEPCYLVNTQFSCTSSGPTAVIAQSQELAMQSTPLRLTILSLRVQEKRGLNTARNADFLNQCTHFRKV